MKFITIVVLFVVLYALIEAKKHNHTHYSESSKWKNYSSQHHLAFLNDQEETDAYENFADLDDEIEEHNKNESNSFKIGHNDFSHWSKKDHNKHKGLVQINIDSKKRDILPGLTNFYGQNHTFQFFGPTIGYVAPDSVDWVKAGWNTPVRNQQQCGDCWAFATTASIEAALWVKNKLTVTLSPQQLTDCSFAYGNNGCNGGVVAFAYGYANDNGLVEDIYYPFYNKETSCNYNNVKTKPLYKVSKYYMVQPKSDAALMEALAKFGPIAVGVDASATGFFSYASGLYANTSGLCSTSIDHAVLLTGYGVDAKGDKYWTIKNQWGTSWGANGYMNISRNLNNNCGISSQAFIPVV